MTIFEKMLDMNVREDFIAYREDSIGQDPEFLAQLAAYLRSEACTNDIIRLMNGEYFFKPPRRVLLKKKCSDKKRAVFMYGLRDRYLQMLIGHVLHDYDHIFPNSLYSFRRNRTASDLINKIKSLKNIESMWILKTDFKSYGDSINIHTLIKQLEKIFSDDPMFLTFTKNLLLDKRFFWKGKLVDDIFCLKTGSPLTNFFENVYAMQIDVLMAKLSVLSGRYGDDMIAFFRSKEEVESAKDILTEEIKKLDLIFNPNKTYIKAPGESVEVLGLKVTGKEVDVADSSIAKIAYRYHKKAKKLVIKKRKYKQSDEWAIEQLIDFTNRRFFYFSEDRHELNWCMWAFPVITRNDSLKEIDHIIQECIRFAGSGKKSDSKYRIRYKQMQQMGYHSLVYYFYHREKLFKDMNVLEVVTR